MLSQGRMYTLPDVWIRPPFGGKGRKVTGQLEAHANGFRYTSPKGEQLDIMYRCVPCWGEHKRGYVMVKKCKCLHVFSRPAHLSIKTLTAIE